MDTSNSDRAQGKRNSPPGAAEANGARPGGSASITHTDLNNFDRWSLDRIEAKARCVVEPGMTCIPLRADRICLQCYDAAKEARS
jgi:hypothetical protein